MPPDRVCAYTNTPWGMGVPRDLPRDGRARPKPEGESVKTPRCQDRLPAEALLLISRSHMKTLSRLSARFSHPPERDARTAACVCSRNAVQSWSPPSRRPLFAAHSACPHSRIRRIDAQMGFTHAGFAVNPYTLRHPFSIFLP